MPTSSHHTSCITDDPEAVELFLTSVVGLKFLMEFDIPGHECSLANGWPENGGAHVKMFGKPPSGIVEVIAIPMELQGHVQSGISLVSFAERDVKRRLDYALELGFENGGLIKIQGDVSITVGMLNVGGITWELVSFDN